MGERPPDPLRLGDTLNAGSSTGWTDEKHMLYISSLEESFVTQLYDGQVNSRGVFCRSPSLWSHKTSYKGNRRHIKVDQHQRYWGLVEADGAESRVSQAEHIGSPSCYGDQEYRKAYYMDDDAATTEPRQERISYHAGLKNSGGSSASHFQWHGHSLSRTELSDQNFVDEETEVSGEQSRGCSKKQLKHAADTTSGLAAPSGNANLQLEVFHHAEGDYSDSSSDFDIGLLNANPASCKVHGPRRWSV